MSIQTLVGMNTPQQFWQLQGEIPATTWDTAIEAAQSSVSWPFPTPLPIEAFLEATLGEGQFGDRRYELGRAKNAYYSIVRPVLPVSLRPLVRKLWRARARRGFRLGWPIEDRYARFQHETLRTVIRLTDVDGLEMRWFWPDRSQFALCLTHDVEAQEGHDFVPRLMELEEQLGFRSCFNFVPGEYGVDVDLLHELRSRGFGIGVHGYRHDGRLFVSKEQFHKTAVLINEALRSWETSGFRSPLTHRQPEWMQALDVEYDLSYFDTDPFEPMPGGTTSIWPFVLGHFIELPYTLPQDHTLFELGEKTSRMWKQKVEFIRKYHGLALLNVHPDYVRAPRNLALYEEFLSWLNEDQCFWGALPCDIAARWRQRTVDETGWRADELVRVELAPDDLSFLLA